MNIHRKPEAHFIHLYTIWFEFCSVYTNLSYPAVFKTQFSVFVCYGQNDNIFELASPEICQYTLSLPVDLVIVSLVSIVLYILLGVQRVALFNFKEHFRWCCDRWMENPPDTIPGGNLSIPIVTNKPTVPNWVPLKYKYTSTTFRQPHPLSNPQMANVFSTIAFRTIFQRGISKGNRKIQIWIPTMR